MTPLGVGLLLVVTGGSVAWFHLGKLMTDKSKTRLWYYVPMTLLGGLAISVGANLIATGIHDRLEA